MRGHKFLFLGVLMCVPLCSHSIEFQRYSIDSMAIQDVVLNSGYFVEVKAKGI